MCCKVEDVKVSRGRMNVTKTSLMKVKTKQGDTVEIGQEVVEEVVEFQNLGSMAVKLVARAIMRYQGMLRTVYLPCY